MSVTEQMQVYLASVFHKIDINLWYDKDVKLFMTKEWEFCDGETENFGGG